MQQSPLQRSRICAGIYPNSTTTATRLIPTYQSFEGSAHAARTCALCAAATCFGLTGYTVKATQPEIATGVWVEAGRRPTVMLKSRPG